MTINPKLAKSIIYPLVFITAFGGIIGSIGLVIWKSGAPNREMVDVRANVKIGMTRDEVISYMGDDYSDSDDGLLQLYMNTKAGGSESVPSLIIIEYKNDRVSGVTSKYAKRLN